MEFAFSGIKMTDLLYRSKTLDTGLVYRVTFVLPAWKTKGEGIIEP